MTTCIITTCASESNVSNIHIVRKGTLLRRLCTLFRGSFEAKNFSCNVSSLQVIAISRKLQVITILYTKMLLHEWEMKNNDKTSVLIVTVNGLTFNNDNKCLYKYGGKVS